METIIYLSSACAQSRFERLVSEGSITSQFQNQKFHHLLLSGLKKVSNKEINVISFYPADRIGKRTRPFEREIEEGIEYIYPKITDVPVVHHLYKFLGSYLHIRKLYRKDSMIVCNIMNYDESQAALAFRFFHKVKVCAIVADVPGLTSGAGKGRDAKWKRFLSRWTMPFYISANDKYDGYLFLTEAMSHVVNKKGKPYVVVEGIADAQMQDIENRLENKYSKKTILYAGGLHREYGIHLLVEAFKRIVGQDVELHIYGKGNYVPELEQAALADPRIKYFGTRSNQEIVIEQLKAHILVNPRPTKEEFVKYSFPSKIMECMASGTPLLTTRLPGIPSDYYPHIYTIDDETVEGIYKAMKKLLEMPIESLYQKGLGAKEFIISKKNPAVQGEKLYDLLERVKETGD